MKKLLALVLAALMLLSFAACSDEDDTTEDLKNYLEDEEVLDHVTLDNGDTYYFDLVDSETVTITAYRGSDAKHALAIPEKLDNKTVVGISAQAFKDCTNITALTMPNTITTIES